jgi:Alpha/beta hydrolase domain
MRIRVAMKDCVAAIALFSLLALGACGGSGDDTSTETPSSAKAVSVASPTVTGPIAVKVPLGDPSHDYPQLATQANLGQYGYVEEEFFFQGNAARYNTTQPQQTATVISTNNPYKSRMIVRRPSDPARFNGVVVVEWVNVTSGYNYDLLWQASSDFFMREGYAYVGISIRSPTTSMPRVRGPFRARKASTRSATSALPGWSWPAVCPSRRADW